MKTISQRELRNDNATIVAGVESGEVYTVTRRGVPVGRLGPVDAEADLRCARPARSRPVFASLPRVTSEVSTEEILADLRGDR
ncbi:type II toxin-antitoxin system Phd/YefM family antitoxin [Agilicoccus flavus]|uniref:type II toxin-antitoxin system Phd/YefM family antitoxin n=1 Tax=Agilicoccus flavus TaxID=2775968 RepID=UPI001CF6AFAD|nr:type II toxin-antitoxin system prevent-host-death family antitoxin [Agilicoccus flavus]